MMTMMKRGRKFILPQKISDNNTCNNFPAGTSYVTRLFLLVTRAERVL